MGEGIVYIFGGYVAWQCQIYELYEHNTYFFILGLENVFVKALSNLNILIEFEFMTINNLSGFTQ